MRIRLRTEDGWAVVTGLLVVALGLLPLAGANALGWVAKATEWTDPALAVGPAVKGTVPGWASVLLTYLFLLAVLGTGAAVMGHGVRRFAAGFTVLFAVGYGGWLLGHNAYLAATTDVQRAKFGIGWSLGLTGEAGYLVALAAGLLVGNLAPGAAAKLREAARAEWYVKTAIVIVGGVLGAKAAEEATRAGGVLVRGLAAIVEAYLIYWAVVYFVARRVFRFSREWAAPLASGISICGVSAAITTGAAIRARPVVPVMVSSLVVVFSVIELVLLPFAAKLFLADQPMVAAAWMGLAVKTDGAAISSGAVTESLVYAEAAKNGTIYQPGWMVLTTTTVKVFIDLFIGVWALVLAVVWAYGIDRTPGARVPLADIWARFPKFVFGYVIAFAGVFALGRLLADVKPLRDGMDQADQLRRVFFVLTFFAIGLGANVRRLWAEGLGRLALVYAVSLFGFVVWVGLLISWLFFRGDVPPLAKGA